MHPIILASKSPRRKQILQWAEIPFEIFSEHTDETYPNDLSVTEIPIFIAKQKAAAVSDKFSDRIILAADTIVVLDEKIIGKPLNEQMAIQTLEKLSDNTHEVITGVSIQKGEKQICFAEITKVRFHELSSSQIAYYISQYKPFDKAGSYGIQEWIGVVGIQSITGDFYNVMGLPISRVVQALNNF